MSSNSVALENWKIGAVRSQPEDSKNPVIKTFIYKVHGLRKVATKGLNQPTCKMQNTSIRGGKKSGRGRCN